MYVIPLICTLEPAVTFWGVACKVGPATHAQAVAPKARAAAVAPNATGIPDDGTTVRSLLLTAAFANAGSLRTIGSGESPGQHRCFGVGSNQGLAHLGAERLQAANMYCIPPVELAYW